ACSAGRIVPIQIVNRPSAILSEAARNRSQRDRNRELRLLPVRKRGLDVRRPAIFAHPVADKNRDIRTSRLEAVSLPRSSLYPCSGYSVIRDQRQRGVAVAGCTGLV